MIEVDIVLKGPICSCDSIKLVAFKCVDERYFITIVCPKCKTEIKGPAKIVITEETEEATDYPH
jgi:hypothetical protein